MVPLCDGCGEPFLLPNATHVGSDKWICPPCWWQWRAGKLVMKKEETMAEPMHYMPRPGVVACERYGANHGTTTIKEHVTCPLCRQILERAKANQDAIINALVKIEGVERAKANQDAIINALVKIEGVGPDAPVVVNERGGKQSDSPYELVASFPHKALLEVGKVIKYGLTPTAYRPAYPEYNWKKITVAEHVNHALVHVLSYLAGDRQEDHLSHFCCRAMMALEMQIEERNCPAAPSSSS